MYINTFRAGSATASDLTRNNALNEILDVVAAEFGVSVQDMMVSCRSHDVWMPRMAAMYFARMLTPMSLISLGEVFGGRSHSTVLRAYRRCRTMIQSDQAWSQRMNRLLAQIVERSPVARAA